ncbi:hypothetical protein OF83DRAFT_943770 [Amylostereum chailletii]|nr:hypothetical protein OF83DRAFT_943770 [Amylostereum chailletii]
MMTHGEFLSVLFKYRQIFHRIAGRSGSTVSHMNICWVDVLLARMVNLVAMIAGDAAFWSPQAGRALGTLSKLQEDSIVRAIAQLPYHWDDVPLVLISGQSSPLLRRLALHLTFAAYILQPSLSGECMRGDILDASQMSSLVNIYGLQHIELEPKASNFDRNHVSINVDGDDVSCAMVVILYSVWDSTHPKEFYAVPRPYVQSLLLHMVRSILDPERIPVVVPCVLSPPKTLDWAQTILCRWAHLPSWCWSTWTDPRLAEMEIISLLTASWLYHSEPRDILEELSREPYCAEIHMMQILHYAVLELSSNCQHTSEIMLQVLKKTCWAVAQLLNPVYSWSVPSSNELAKQLCILFTLCDDSEQGLNVKDLIIESLTHAQQNVIRGALQAIIDNPNTNDSSTKKRFGDMFFRTRRVMTTANLGASSLTHVNARTVHLILSFFTIVGCSGAPNPVHRSILSPFLSALTDHIVTKATSAPSLVGPFLHCLSFGGFGGCNTAGYFLKIWDVHGSHVGSCDRAHLLSTSALACHILATAKTEPVTPLVGVEIWDKIRDVFLLTLASQYLEDEPLALLIAPTLCLALCAILCHGDPCLVRWVSASPWTGSMCAALENILNRDEAKLSLPDKILRERVALPAETLVKLVCHNLRFATYVNVYVVGSAEIPESGSGMFGGKLPVSTHFIL